MQSKSVLGIIGKILRYLISVVFLGAGALFIAASVILFAESDPGAGVVALIFGAMLFAIGLALLVYSIRRGQHPVEPRPFGNQPYAAPQGYPGPGDTNINQPLVAAPVETPVAQAATPDASAAFDRLVLRSSDIIATLKDVAAHDRANHALLAEMLERSGIVSWNDAPKMETVKLTRNGRFWINARLGDLEVDDVNLVFATEAALNIEQDVAALRLPANEQGIMAVLTRVADLDLTSSKTIGRVPLEDVTSPTDGEWNLRLRVADYLENAPSPFRITFDMQSNLREGLVEIAVDVPLPASFSVLTADPLRKVASARAYALRSALYAARAAFEASKRVKKVTIHCNEPYMKGEPATLMRLTATRESLAGLLAASRNPSIDANGFVRDDSIEVTFDNVGWFAPICPWAGFTTPELDLAGRFDPVEAMDGPCPEPLAIATGARTYADLGINENGKRVAAWNTVSKTLGDTTGSAVTALVALRNTARDVTVVEAAERTSKALVEGTIDASDRKAMGDLFVNGSSLDRVYRRVNKSVDGDVNPDEVEQAIKSLEEALSPIAEMGIYLDDTDSVYRYFNSVSERFTYNRTFASDTRTVKLVPDSYYMAHSLAARLHSSLGHVDEALAHADELLRMAPVTTDAALVKVRILEDASRVFEAADLLKEYIDKSSSVRDMAICLYRLAFMEWKRGRSDLAVACYQRSIGLFPPNAPQAEEELNDLLANDSSLKRLANDDEVRKVLADADIPCGPIGNLRMNALNAAMACIDANIFSVGRPMLGTVIDTNRDDAVEDVHRSLKPLG